MKSLNPGDLRPVILAAERARKLNLWLQKKAAAIVCIPERLKLTATYERNTGLRFASYPIMKIRYRFVVPENTDDRSK